MLNYLTMGLSMVSLKAAIQRLKCRSESLLAIFVIVSPQLLHCPCQLCWLSSIDSAPYFHYTPVNQLGIVAVINALLFELTFLGIIASELDFLFDKGDNDERWLLCETIFKRVYILDGKITQVELNFPFAPVASRTETSESFLSGQPACKWRIRLGV